MWTKIISNNSGSAKKTRERLLNFTPKPAHVIVIDKVTTMVHYELEGSNKARRRLKGDITNKISTILIDSRTGHSPSRIISKNATPLEISEIREASCGLWIINSNYARHTTQCIECSIVSDLKKTKNRRPAIEGWDSTDTALLIAGHYNTPSFENVEVPITASAKKLIDIFTPEISTDHINNCVKEIQLLKNSLEGRLATLSTMLVDLTSMADDVNNLENQLKKYDEQKASIHQKKLELIALHTPVGEEDGR